MITLSYNVIIVLQEATMNQNETGDLFLQHVTAHCGQIPTAGPKEKILMIEDGEGGLQCVITKKAR